MPDPVKTPKADLEDPNLEVKRDRLKGFIPGCVSVAGLLWVTPLLGILLVLVITTAAYAVTRSMKYKHSRVLTITEGIWLGAMVSVVVAGFIVSVIPQLQNLGIPPFV